MPDPAYIINELKENAAVLTGKMRDIVNRAESENRDLTTEEDTEIQRMRDERTALRNRAKRRQDILDMETEDNASRGRVSLPADESAVDAITIPEILTQRGIYDASQLGGLQNAATPEYQNVFRRSVNAAVNRRPLPVEAVNTMQADSETGGGLLLPVQTATELLQRADDAFFMRTLGTGHTLTNAGSLGAVGLDRDLSDAEWTAELEEPSKDEISFSGRALEPHMMSKEVLISRLLLNVASLPVEQIVRDRLAYVFGRTFEKASVAGNGNKKALGVFVESPLGIDGNRDLETETVGAVSFDDVKRTKRKCKQVYRNARSFSWLMHPDIVTELDLLKHPGTGEYIWRESIREGEPDILLKVPVHESEFAPSTMADGTYALMCGDFRYYWYVDLLGMTIDVHNLEIRRNKVGFIARFMSDGMPILGEAFSRLKMKTA